MNSIPNSIQTIEEEEAKISSNQACQFYFSLCRNLYRFEANHEKPFQSDTKMMKKIKTKRRKKQISEIRTKADKFHKCFSVDFMHILFQNKQKKK